MAYFKTERYYIYLGCKKISVMLKPSIYARLWIFSIFFMLVAVGETGKEKYGAGEKNSARERTLFDYNELDPIEIGNSPNRERLRILVRVKRNKQGNAAFSLFNRKPNYLENLADSFPRTTVTDDNPRINAMNNGLDSKLSNHFLENLKYKSRSINKNVIANDIPFVTRSTGLGERTLENFSAILNDDVGTDATNVVTLTREKRSEQEVEKVREPLEKEALPSSRILEARSLQNRNARGKDYRRNGKGKKNKRKHKRVKNKKVERVYDAFSKRQRSKHREHLKLQRKTDEEKNGGKLNVKFHRVNSRIGKNSNFIANNAESMAIQNSKFNELHELKQELKLREKRSDYANARLNSEDDNYDELKYFESIQEPETESAQCPRDDKVNIRNDKFHDNAAIKSATEAKEFAERLVEKVNELHNYLTNKSKKKKREKTNETPAIDELCSNVSIACAALEQAPNIIERCSSTGISKLIPTPGVTKQNFNYASESKQVGIKKKRLTKGKLRRKNAAEKVSKKRDANKKRDTKWGNWTDWSSCTVTCGKGRQIRWRYCLQDCSSAETEMEEKACRLPACPPGKFLGLF